MLYKLGFKISWLLRVNCPENHFLTLKTYSVTITPSTSHQGTKRDNAPL